MPRNTDESTSADAATPRIGKPIRGVTVSQRPVKKPRAEKEERGENQREDENEDSFFLHKLIIDPYSTKGR